MKGTDQLRCYRPGNDLKSCSPPNGSMEWSERAGASPCNFLTLIEAI